ncbi:MAG: hypothetical protein DRQ58_08950, partial [Gammaproteobacteria bacterium]
KLSSMIFLITIFVVLILVYITFALLRFTPENIDPAKSIYNKFRHKLSRCGIHSDVYEGPVDFANRAALARSDLASQIKNITDIYIAIRYGSNNALMSALQDQVQSFRPSTRQA